MCQSNNIIKLKPRQHITKEIRIVIEHLYNVQGKNRTEIAEEIGKSRSAVSREVKQGLVTNLNSDFTEKQVYSSVVSQRNHDLKATAKGPNIKLSNDHALAKYIEEEISNKKSPEVIANAIKKNREQEIKICFKTIYNYIDKEILMLKRSDLTHGNYKTKKKVKREENTIRKINKAGRTIHDRPIEAADRKEVNHWEMDTVEGNKGTNEPILLVLSERSSCREIIRLIGSKTQEEVGKALDKIERELGAKKFRETFKTITTDNGGEFLNYKRIEKSCINKTIPRTSQYYADAYCAWQRGTNENINKMIRRFLPKGTSFKNLTAEEVKRIEHWINNYPRKKFNFKTSYEVYDEKTVA